MGAGGIVTRVWCGVKGPFFKLSTTRACLYGWKTLVIIILNEIELESALLKLLFVIMQNAVELVL